MGWNQSRPIGRPCLQTKTTKTTKKSFLAPVLRRCRTSFSTLQSFDWTSSYAKQDIKDAVNEVSSCLPTLPKDYKQTIFDAIQSVYPYEKFPPISLQRGLLFPPGKCIHLYRDGKIRNIGKNIVPCCTFFSEIVVHRRMIHDHTVDTGYVPADFSFWIWCGNTTVTRRSECPAVRFVLRRRTEHRLSVWLIIIIIDRNRMGKQKTLVCFFWVPRSETTCLWNKNFKKKDEPKNIFCKSSKLYISGMSIGSKRSSITFLWIWQTLVGMFVGNIYRAEFS